MNEQTRTPATADDDGLIRLSFGVQVRAINEGERSAEFILSSDVVDSYGEVLVQDWDLTRYEANPVVLFGHRSWELPIGYAENVRVEKGKLLGKLFFVDKDANPLAEQVWQGVRQKSLRAVSVGFRSKQGQSKEIDGRFVYVLSGNELIETSVVPIGANPEAVALRAKSMSNIRALVARDAPATPEKKSMSTKSAKTWNQLTNMQRHTLLLEDEPRARAMQEEQSEIDAAPWAHGKSFAELTFTERANFANTDRKAYDEALAAHESADEVA